MSEILRPNPIEIELWAKENLGEITKNMEQIRKDSFWAHTVLEDYKEAVKFAPDKRLLSEMSVCRSTDLITAPEGFSAKNGTVSWELYGGSKPHPHTFFWKDGEIVCLTAGQFIDPENPDLLPGHRIAVLKEKAPNLVKKYSDQVYILYGAVNEIEKIGLGYKLND